MKKIFEEIDETIKILHKRLKSYKKPLVSSENWQEIPKKPFTVLISCLLSLRTKDEITEKASIRLLSKHNTPKKILGLSETDIIQKIYPVGFYRVKAKRIKKISEIIQNRYSGEVPKNFDKLLSLKGVGRKTANIVMLYGFKKKNYLPIDTHCHRIPNRIGWINTKKPLETEKKLKKIVPKKHWYIFNPLFVTFGQKICLPRSPFCSECPIENKCQKTQVKESR
ncbi:MAG: endonuclease III [Candidatus Thermoplasmatota archaeon]